MTETDRLDRNAKRLNTCAKWIRPKIAAIISDLTSHGFRPRIQESYRSPADQLEAYNTGHSKLRFGFHNVTVKLKGNGLVIPCACAVDLYDDDNPLTPSIKYLLMLTLSARSHGLTTGILWGLTPRQKTVVETALSERRFDTPIRTGWDSWHIEPKGTTAKAIQEKIRNGEL